MRGGLVYSPIFRYMVRRTLSSMVRYNAIRLIAGAVSSGLKGSRPGLLLEP